MNKHNIDDLKRIKENIREGIYPIALQPEWDKYAEILSRCGGLLINDIEEMRNKIHPINISLFFIFSRQKMHYLDASYHQLLQEYELFFDACMRFLKTIIDGDTYTDKQKYQKDYITEILMHCSKAIEHITNLVEKKSREYKHCQMLLCALTALIIALTSLSIGMIPIFQKAYLWLSKVVG